jgi:hypothetical protein
MQRLLRPYMNIGEKNYFRRGFIGKSKPLNRQNVRLDKKHIGNNASKNQPEFPMLQEKPSPKSFVVR